MSELGKELIEGLTELRDVVKSGEPIDEHFVVHRVLKPKKRPSNGQENGAKDHGL